MLNFDPSKFESITNFVYLWVKEGDEGEGPERLGNEYVGYLPKLGEVVLFSTHIFISWIK